MASLTGSSIASSYEQLLALPDGGLNGTTLVAITDGDSATEVGFKISTNALSMNSTNQLQFGDTGTYIHQSADGVLDLVSDTEIEINATTIDMNGALDLSGNATIGGQVAIGASIGSFKLEVSGGDIGFFKSVSAGSGINNLLTLGATDGGVNMGGGEGAGILFKIPDDETNPSIGAQIGAIKESADDSISSTALVFSTSQNDETLDEAMRIDSSGNVGIGATTITTGFAPNLTIEGGSPALLLRDTTSSNTATQFYTIYSANGDIKHYFDHEKSLNFASSTDNLGSGESTKLKIDGETGNSDFQGNYIVNEQGRQNHVANTMSSPYYRFDGVDDKIEDSDFGGANFSSPSGSISVWVMSHDRDNPSLQGVVTNGSTGSGRQDLSINNNRFEYSVHNGSTVSQLFQSGTITENIWYHVVVTREYDGTDTLLKMYINGVLDASSTVSSFVQDSSVNPLIIGYLNSSRYFNGQIACVRVWNHILSATEVKDDYSGASVPFKYKGANQTNLLGSLDFSSGWTNVSSNMTINSATSITAGATNSLILKNYGALTAGKNYRVRIAGTIDSGVLKVQDVNGSATILTTTASTFDESVEFTYPSGSTNRQPIAILIATNGATANITHFSYTQIGAVAQYDGSGIASDEWFDKSGNDLHGTVSGATVENAPSNDDGLIYEEGTFTVDNNSDGTGALSAQLGEYTRIGNAVHFRIVINVSTNFASNSIGGLPYTCNQSASPSSLIGGVVALTSADNDEPIIATVSAGGTTVSFFSGTDATDTHLPNTTNDIYRLTGTYFT